MFTDVIILSIFALLQEPYLEPQLLAGNIIALQGSPFAVFYQPALIGNRISVEWMGSEPFSISGLILTRGAITWQGWGLGLSQIKSDIYRESEICVANALNISGIKVGISLSGSKIQMGKDNFSNFVIVLGTLTRLPWVKVSLHYRVSGIRERGFKSLPTVLGISAVTGENPIIFFDIEQETGFDPEWRISTSWAPIGWLSIATGVSAQPPLWILSVSAGHRPSVHYAIRVHTVLGITHSVSIGWNP